MFDAQDKEASMIIEKLRQFIHVDVDAIPHVMVSKQSRFGSLLIAMATHCLYINFTGENVFACNVLACKPAVHPASHVSH